MIWVWIAAFVAVWAGFGVLTYGQIIGYHYVHFMDVLGLKQHDLTHAFVMSAGGPIGLAACLAVHKGWYRMRWTMQPWPPSDPEFEEFARRRSQEWWRGQ